MLSQTQLMDLEKFNCDFLFCSISTTMTHNSNDLLVFSNGTVLHSVIINAEINCEVNLFNYPFAADECPVAIQTYSTGGKLGNFLMQM